ncbi:MAG: hypothetical protein R2940_02710 [Syntrophotaleaceae bacterium]
MPVYRLMDSSDVRKNSLSPIACFLLAASLILFAGCTTVHKDFRSFSPVYEPGVKVAGKVAIVLSDELSSFYYVPRDFQEFSLGPVICENARKAATAVFGEPLFFDNMNDAVSAHPDFIGVLRPRGAYLYSIKEIPVTVVTYASLTWELFSGDSKRLYGATIYGDGKDQRTLGMADVRYETSMQQCMDALAANLYKVMLEVPQRASKNPAASEQIRKAVEGYQRGSTTYAQHLNEKNREWHLFALQERVEFNGRNFSYVFDPVSKKHTSVIGWTSHWGLRLPAMESLRPSVYLPQSMIEHSKVKSVFIQEMVGSVYDDRPLCELVFEGDSISESVLKYRSCPSDFSSSSAYLSVDAFENRKLNDTACKWLNLRLGMSREEAGQLIGAPKRLIYDSTVDATTFEYGYGRVKFYGKNDEGLSGWQLD